jgi:hypothetical protein
MEKDIGKIAKNQDTDIIVRIDDFGGKIGLTVREFTNNSKTGYTGFTKSGTRIPAEKFLEFREIINSINLDDLKAAPSEDASSESSAQESKPEKKEKSSDESIEDY